MGDLIIKQLTSSDEAKWLDRQFAEHYPWYKQGDYYDRCLQENIAGHRVTLLAFYKEALAGCCHLLYQSVYPYFRERQIPEINDLNVFPIYRRRKIASRMFDELESIASTSSSCIGLGVGLYKDYGYAQRMYTTRGYVLDGQGMTYKNVQVEPGKTVMVDDDLLVYLIKQLG